MPRSYTDRRITGVEADLVDTVLLTISNSFLAVQYIQWTDGPSLLRGTLGVAIHRTLCLLAPPLTTYIVRPSPPLPKNLQICLYVTRTFSR